MGGTEHRNTVLESSWIVLLIYVNKKGCHHLVSGLKNGLKLKNVKKIDFFGQKCKKSQSINQNSQLFLPDSYSPIHV